MSIRHLFSMLLMLTLGLTSATAGSARGQMRVAGEIVICSGQGVVTISIDAQGNPTGPIHICPDCVLTLLETPEYNLHNVLIQSGWQKITQRWVHILLPRADLARSPMARGPPRDV